MSFSKLNPGRSNEAQQGTFATNRANAPFIARSPGSGATSWEPPTPTSPTQVTLPRNEPNWRLSQKPGRDLSSEAPTHRRKLQLLPRSQQHTITPSPHSVSNNQLPSPVSAAPQRDTASNDLASTMNWRYRQHNDEDEVSWRSYPHSALRKNQRTKNPRWTRDKEIDQVNQNIHEFFVVSEDLDAAISRFSRLAVEDQYIFIHRIVSFSIKSDSADVKFVSDFLGRIKGNLFSSRMLEEAFRPTAENLKDIGWKFPNARMNYIKLLKAAGLDPGETLARLVRVSLVGL